ncbi:hypothetical protein C8R44DRAFT_873082 [Mycena epipterygia]|nr:hypothetical protein C8R44DRAFT_873082 [Mycena epipterygia]
MRRILPTALQRWPAKDVRKACTHLTALPSAAAVGSVFAASGVALPYAKPFSSVEFGRQTNFTYVHRLHRLHPHIQQGHVPLRAPIDINILLKNPASQWGTRASSFQESEPWLPTRGERFVDAKATPHTYLASLRARIPVLRS